MLSFQSSYYKAVFKDLLTRMYQGLSVRYFEAGPYLQSNESNLSLRSWVNNSLVSCKRHGISLQCFLCSQLFKQLPRVSNPEFQKMGYVRHAI